MVLVVFVVFVDRIIVKLALQATLRVFGLCGSCVVLVWADLWFLVTCGFCVWSARPIQLMWFLWIGGLALDVDADGCASSYRWALWIGGLALDANADDFPQVLRVQLLFLVG